MSFTRITLNVTVDVELNGTPVNEITENLRNIVDNAFSNGTITGDSEATVENWNNTVSVA